MINLMLFNLNVLVIYFKNMYRKISMLLSLIFNHKVSSQIRLRTAAIYCRSTLAWLNGMQIYKYKDKT